MRLFAAAALVFMAACASSTAPAPATSANWKSGKEFAPGKTLPLGEVTSAKADTEVQIEGSVTKVCQGRGCWVEVTDGSAHIIAKSIRHDVLFPKDCVGRKARILGVVRVGAPDECKGGEAHGKDHECPKPQVLVEIVGAQMQ